MIIAEGKTLPFTGPEAIDSGVLETFEYDGPTQEIVTETNEFSAVCPYSGLPDYARLTVTYSPDRKCVELKSLKYYIISFRSVGIFQEQATARIAADLFRTLAPKSLVVKTVYHVRGGFETTCTVKLPSPNA
jgi:7-cyano-7-deazaguanine reductase